MTRQVLKTFNGYSVTYHSERKFNPFVITDHGKVVAKFGDFKSCMIWIYDTIGNFETMKLC